MSLARELRNLADWHNEQANDLERNSHLDALAPIHEEHGQRAARTDAINAHRKRAQDLNTEADQS